MLWLASISFLVSIKYPTPYLLTVNRGEGKQERGEGKRKRGEGKRKRGEGKRERGGPRPFFLLHPSNLSTHLLPHPFFRRVRNFGHAVHVFRCIFRNLNLNPPHSLGHRTFCLLALRPKVGHVSRLFLSVGRHGQNNWGETCIM